MKGGSIDELLHSERQERAHGNYAKCLLITKAILEAEINKESTEVFESIRKVVSMMLLDESQSMRVVICSYQFIIAEYFDRLTKDEQAELFRLLSCIITKSHMNEFQAQTAKMQKLIAKSKLNDLKKYIIKVNIDINSSSSTTMSEENVKVKKTKSKSLTLAHNDLKNSYISLTDNSEVNPSTNVSFNNLSSFRSVEAPLKVINEVMPIRNGVKSNKNTFAPSYTVDRSLPYIALGVSATLSSQQFTDLLNESLLFLSFQLMGVERNSSVYEYTEPNCLKKVVNRIVLCKQSYSTMTIEISISLPHSIDKYSRIIELKSIRGKAKDLEASFAILIKKVVVHLNKIRIVKKSKWVHIPINSIISAYLNAINTAYSQKLCFGQKTQTKRTAILIESEGNDCSFIEETSKEASKYYQIYKILSQENYGLGKQLASFIAAFKKNNSNVSQAKSLIPSQMKSIVNMVEDTVITLSNFNSNGSLNYIRPSSEQFIFNKVYYVLFDLYKAKHKEENERYRTKREAIKEKGIKYAMKHLEIKTKYQGNAEDDSIAPYKVSIDLINKIEYEQVPNGKVENLMKSSLELRNSILSMTNGQGELDSMDDELPLFIYLATQICISNFVAELHFVDDYLKCSTKGCDDNKVVMNLFSAVYFISNSWDKVV